MRLALLMDVMSLGLIQMFMLDPDRIDEEFCADAFALLAGSGGTSRRPRGIVWLLVGRRVGRRFFRRLIRGVFSCLGLGNLDDLFLLRFRLGGCFLRGCRERETKCK